MRIFAFFTLFLLPAVTSAQALSGVGTRAQGMGGAFVAVADDASAVYWNPAGLATGSTFNFQVADTEGPMGSGLFVGVTLPVLGFSYYRTHTVQGFPDRQDEGSEKVQIRPVTTSNTGVTFVQSIVRSLVVGGTLRLVHGGVDGFDSETRGDLDAGAMWVSATGLRLGVVGRNLRQPEFESDLGTVRIARQARAGVAFAPRSAAAGVHGPLTVAFDADLMDRDTEKGPVKMGAFGAEYWLLRGAVGLRGGLSWTLEGDAPRALSGGATVRLPRSFYIEGHVTEPEESDDRLWGVGVGIAF